MTFFDLLKIILMKSGTKEAVLEHPEFEKAFSPYMLARYLSMRADLVVYARLINHLNTTCLDKRQMFLFAWDNIPKQSKPYIPYIKKTKKEKK